MTKDNNNSLGVDKYSLSNIIRNSYVTSILIGVALYVLKAHLPVRFAEGFVFGAICGVTNLYLLSRIIRSTITTGKAKLFSAISWLVGLLVLVAVYLVVFSQHWFNDMAMVIGFSYIFIEIVVRGAIGMAGTISGRDKKG